MGYDWSVSVSYGHRRCTKMDDAGGNQGTGGITHSISSIFITTITTDSGFLFDFICKIGLKRLSDK